MVYITLLESVKGKIITNILTHHKISLNNSLQLFLGFSLHRLKIHAILFSTVCLVIFFTNVKTTLTDFFAIFHQSVPHQCLIIRNHFVCCFCLYKTVHKSIYVNILILALPTFFLLLCYPFKT